MVQNNNIFINSFLCIYTCLINIYIAVSYAGEEPFVPDEILVKYSPSATTEDIQQVESENNLTLLSEIKPLRIRQYKLPKDKDVYDAMSDINSYPMVEFTEPNYYQHPKAVPNDPGFSKQWYLHNTGQIVNARDGPADVDIDWPEAMDFYTGIDEITVAVIDSGVAFDHPEIFSNLWFNQNDFTFDGVDDDGNSYIDDAIGWDFVDNDNEPLDENGHGTLVASIIGGISNNNDGIAGVASHVRIMPLRIFNDFASGTVSDFITAAVYAADKGAKIINYSGGGASFSLLAQQLVDYLNTQGILLIAAAGNGEPDGVGDDNDQFPFYPASYAGNNIISVAATDRNDDLAIFSNYGATSVDVAAPGTDIYGADIHRSNIYLEDYETGGAGWTQGHLPLSSTTYDWSLFVDTIGNTSITDSIDVFGLPALYAPLTNSWVMSPQLSLQHGSQLLFDASYNLEYLYDNLLVEISTDQVNWNVLWILTGSSLFERLIKLDISSYDLQNVYVRFRLISDDSIQFDGVYLDNVAISQVDIFQYDGSQYQYKNGTSFSAPIVSGAAAVVMSQRPDLTYLQIRSIILNNVDQIPQLNGQVASGGRLNLNNTLQEAINYAPGEVQFNSDSYVTDEGSGTVSVTVERINGSDGEISVNYSTSDGSAIAGDDYTESTGTLVFLDQEISKSFNVSIIDDSDIENDETINLSLNSPVGTTIGALSNSSITIKDNEPVSDIKVVDTVPPEDDLQIDYGDVIIGESDEQIINVINDGNADLLIGEIGSVDPITAPFSLSEDNCTSNILIPGSNCILKILYTPTVTGSNNDSFDIPSDHPDENPISVNLTGSGINPPPPQFPDIVVIDSVLPQNDHQIDFGEQNVGDVAVQLVTLTNTGDADLIIGNIGAINPLNSPFSISNDTCTAAVLSPSDNCSFNIRYAPTAASQFSGSFDIPSNDPDDNPVIVSVSGTAIVAPPPQVPDITVLDFVDPQDDLQIDFGDVTVGKIAAQLVAVANKGNSDLNIGNIAIFNPLAAPFSLSQDSCSASVLSPTDSCPLNVKFTPTEAGQFSDTFDIPSNDPDENPVTVSISGTGVAPLPPQEPANNPPSIPQLISPADGATGLSTTLTFQWNNATDPDGDTVSYEIIYCDNPAFTGCTSTIVASIISQGFYIAGMGTSGTLLIGLIGSVFGSNRRRIKDRMMVVVVVMVCNLLLACGGGGGGGNGGNGTTPISSDESFTVSGLVTNTTYYWKVIAVDNNGGRTETAVRSFTTQ